MKDCSDSYRWFQRNIFRKKIKVSKYWIYLKFLKHEQNAEHSWPQTWSVLQFLTKTKLASVRCPVVFISGLSDQLVPPSMMLDLYTQCSSERKLLLQIPNGDHNATWTKPQYYSQLARCIADVCSERSLEQERHLTVHTVW